MFEDILGTVDYDKQFLRKKLKAKFKQYYKRNTIRIKTILYDQKGTTIDGVFKTSGPEIVKFCLQHIVPILDELCKPRIILKNLEYDAGELTVDIEWSDNG
jgi:hypothetical protein